MLPPSRWMPLRLELDVVLMPGYRRPRFTTRLGPQTRLDPDHALALIAAGAKVWADRSVVDSCLPFVRDDLRLP
jgi:hypothetical protein